MEFEESLVNLLSKQEPSKNEEIQKFSTIINSFKYDQDPINKVYIQIFNDIIEKRLLINLEPEPDYLYLWKATQAIRILTRNKEIKKEMYKENHIQIYKLCIEKLVSVKTKGKVIESTIVELMSIIQRYFYSQKDKNEPMNENYINMIIESNIIDNFILLYSSENEHILKLLESIFNKESYSILNKDTVMQKFEDIKTIKILLTFLEDKIRGNRPLSSLSTNSNNANGKNYMGIFAILDLFSYIMKIEEVFVNRFINLKGYKILFELIKGNYENEKEKLNIKKAIYIIQFLSRKLDYKKFNDIQLFISFFEYFLENKTNEEDLYILEMAIRSFYHFASNLELVVITKSKWSKLLFRLLLLLSLRVRDSRDPQDQKNLIIMQCYIIRILRQIYSFERNRNIFTQMIPQNIFRIFDSIPLRWEVGSERTFEESTNALSLDETELLLQKVNRILFSDTGKEEVIGDYKILEMIGKGGFGSVYKVENLYDKKQYAMKMVRLEPEQIKYFKEHKQEMYKAISEIRIWKKFDHPNIIGYDNGFLLKEDCYIVMELVEGLSLGEYISYLKENNRKIDNELAIKIILQIVCGLRYMHKQAKVIFRDLNPNNIMLDYSYNVKLIDFGLTVEEGKTKKVSTILNQSVQYVFEGSVMYSSPEIMRNEVISYESDIWALGCTIYEMIKLRPPFTGDNSLTVANNVCEGNYEKLKEKDFENKEIIKLVENCLIVDTKKRYNIDNVCQLLGPFMFDYFSEIKNEETSK